MSRYFDVRITEITKITDKCIQETQCLLYHRRVTVNKTHFYLSQQIKQKTKANNISKIKHTNKEFCIV